MREGDELAAWLRARSGKLTASRMNDAMDYLKGGKTPSAKRSKLMRELLAERLTDGENVQHFVTDAMRWGLEKEAEAKAAYEDETGILVADAGFYDHPRIDNLGATPDGLLPGGLIETKCPTTPTFVEWVMRGGVPEEHKAQMVIQCACTGRAWCEFVAFDPRIKNPARRLFVRRYEPTAEEIATIETAAETFLAELDAMWEAFHQAAA
jgi:hypothetical protein